MSDAIQILGIAGSLRQGSYNRATLRAAQQLAPADARVEIFDLNGLPPFNQDDEAHPHPKVPELKTKVRAADAILFVTPEYNFSIPGVLKNAIDWGSRPRGDNSWDGKPVAIISASTGLLGGARAQYHLRQVFIFLDMHPINKPEVMIGNCAERFDQNGNLTDEKTRALVAQLLQNLVHWTRQLRK